MAEMAQKKRKPHCDFPIRSIKSWITHVVTAQGSSALLHRVLRPHYRCGQGGEAALSNQRIPEDAFDDSCWFKYQRERESFHCHFFAYISSRPSKIPEWTLVTLVLMRVCLKIWPYAKPNFDGWWEFPIQWLGGSQGARGIHIPYFLSWGAKELLRVFQSPNSFPLGWCPWQGGSTHRHKALMDLTERDLLVAASSAAEEWVTCAMVEKLDDLWNMVI